MKEPRVSYRRRMVVLIKNGQTNCGVCGGDLTNEIIRYLKFREKQKLLSKKGSRMDNPSKRRLEINIDCDHIIPRSKGGLNRISNYQLTHRTCNNKKSNNLSTPLTSK